MKKITFLLVLFALAFNTASAQTVFDFDTNAVDNGNNVTEAIDGITVTFNNDTSTDPDDTSAVAASSFGGSSGDIVLASSASSATFTFSEAVDVNSIIAIEAATASLDYTFTPTGGSNSPVVVSLVGGVAPTVNLNWTGVTSFTVTSSGGFMAFDDLSVSAIASSPSGIVFDFDTNAVDNGNNITEAIDGITVTFNNDTSTDPDDTSAVAASSFGGSSGDIVLASSASSATFTFSEAVDVNSIIAIEAATASLDYTFTPTGGSNSPVVVSLVGGVAPTVNLNWTGVTSFTVTSSGGFMAFDDLSVSAIASSPSGIVFDFDTNAVDNGNNITEAIDGITVTFNNDTSTDPDDTSAVAASSFGGSSGDIVLASSASSATFTFSEAVDVNSIIAIEAATASLDYTFTPTGGSNSPVVVSLVGGVAPTVNLNWTGVTSFTVTSSGGFMAFDDLSVSAIASSPSGIVFDFDTNAVDNGNNITEAIDGITVTFNNDTSTDPDDTSAVAASSFGGSSGDIVLASSASSATFTFSEAVDVNSIIAIEAATASLDYTFTPTGGSNSPVVVSLVGGVAPTVNLNWTGVTSFTVTSSGGFMAFDDLSVSAIASSPSGIVFDFDTNAVDNGNNITEAIDGITVTFNNDTSTDPDDTVYTGSADGYGGASGFAVLASGSSATFTFSEAVDVNSIIAVELFGRTLNYTFTPTGGSNSPVVVSLVDGVLGSAVDLNWTGVTSFTVTSSGGLMAFDDLSVSDATLSIPVNYISQKTRVYPNPVQNILNIKNVSDLKYINVYNSLGQMVLQSKQEHIDVSNLTKGMYILQIHTAAGTETKRIIKK
ncbi:T9SS type A sorting domain-containing protein [Polaribacter vadi]|uniref:T9SS type A sorting domain-containing protein n=1 Tax=Polaribacter vadi TaxID=1774273 RepID=UPI0030F6FFD3